METPDRFADSTGLFDLPTSLFLKCVLCVCVCVLICVCKAHYLKQTSLSFISQQTNTHSHTETYVESSV